MVVGLLVSKDGKVVNGIYFIRRRYHIPRGEIERYYWRNDLTPSDYLFACDYKEEDDDEWVVS